MKAVWFMKTFHVPEWLTVSEAGRILASHEVEPGEMVTSLSFGVPVDTKPSWCWRHFTHDVRAPIGWTIETIRS